MESELVGLENYRIYKKGEYETLEYKVRKFYLDLILSGGSTKDNFKNYYSFFDLAENLHLFFKDMLDHVERRVYEFKEFFGSANVNRSSKYLKVFSYDGIDNIRYNTVDNINDIIYDPCSKDIVICCDCIIAARIYKNPLYEFINESFINSRFIMYLESNMDKLDRDKALLFIINLD